MDKKFRGGEGALAIWVSVFRYILFIIAVAL